MEYIGQKIVNFYQILLLVQILHISQYKMVLFQKIIVGYLILIALITCRLETDIN